MIEIANKTNNKAHLRFFIDDAETCERIPSDSIDIVFFVGLLEHLPNPSSCFTSSRRVLKEHGVLIGLTPNKFSPWYSAIKPLLDPVKRLSSDRFYSAKEIKRFLYGSGFREVKTMYWGRVPPHNIGRILTNRLDITEKLARSTPLKYLFGDVAFKTSA